MTMRVLLMGVLALLCACSDGGTSGESGVDGSAPRQSASGKKCMRSKDHLSCFCKADPEYAPTSPDGEPFEPVEACDPGVKGKAYCCTGAKKGVERCKCETLACRANDVA